MSQKSKKSSCHKPAISKIAATALVVAVAVLSVALGRMILGYDQKLDNLQASSQRSKGNPKANFKVVEYIDFQCPACAKGAKILREYVEQYHDKIYLSMKYFPLSQMHKYALLASQYAECAAKQNKFWPMHDRLIDQQSLWDRMLNAETAFRDMAKEIGLDISLLDVCLADKKTEAGILADKEKGKSLGVQSTPTYFINEKMMVGTKSLQTELDNYFGKKTAPPETQAKIPAQTLAVPPQTPAIEPTQTK